MLATKCSLPKSSIKIAIMEKECVRTELCYNPTIPMPGAYPKEKWKQLENPLVDDCIKEM